MNNEKIFAIAQSHMEGYLKASQANAKMLYKDTAMELVQNFKSCACEAYSLGVHLIEASEEKDAAFYQDKLKYLYVDVYKPAFNALLQEVKK